MRTSIHQSATANGLPWLHWDRYVKSFVEGNATENVLISASHSVASSVFFKVVANALLLDLGLLVLDCWSH